MMSTLPILDLLAKGRGAGAPADDTESTVKFIFFGIIAFIWFVGWIMAQMKKQADRQRWNNPKPPQQDWSNLLRDLTAGQNKPFNPSMPAPPQVLPPAPQRPPRTQYPQVHAYTQQPPPQQKVQVHPYTQQPPRQQIKSFAQQSPRPFVQQYRQQIPQRPAPTPRRVMQAPKPIQKRPKSQRRPPAIPQTASVPKPPEAQIGLIQDSTVTMGKAGGATSVQSSTARSSGGPLTRSQLRKLILWSEVLSPPLAIRES